MAAVRKPNRSRSVQAVGAYLVLMGLLAADYTFGYLAEPSWLTRRLSLPLRRVLGTALVTAIPAHAGAAGS